VAKKLYARSLRGSKNGESAQKHDPKAALGGRGNPAFSQESTKCLTDLRKGEQEPEGKRGRAGIEESKKEVSHGLEEKKGEKDRIEVCRTAKK